MHTRSKLALAGLTAALVMGLAAGSDANRLSVSSRTFRVTWTKLSFFSEGGIINPTLECPVTFEGSLHSSVITKTAGSLSGYVTKAIIGSAACTGGHATILQEKLPWHLTYEGFTGGLPRITGFILAVHTTAFLIETGGLLCLYQENGTARSRVTVNISGGVATSITHDTTIRLPKFSGSSFCPSEGGLEGNSNQPTVLGSTTTITIRLI